MDPDLAQRLQAYLADKSVLTQRQKAEREKEIRELAVYRKAVPKGVPLTRWLSQIVEESYTSVIRRCALLNKGEWVTLLWNRLNEGSMGLGPAALLSVEANKLATDLSIPREQALSDLLSHTTKGTKPRKAKSKRVKAKSGKSTRKDVPKEAKTKEFWTELRVLVQQFLEERLGLDYSSNGRKILSDFETDFRVAYEGLLRKIRNVEHQNKPTGEIPRHQILKACDVLGLDHPTPTRPLDPEVEKRKYRKLAAQFHPDRNPGKDERIEAQFREVVRAHDLLVSYFERIKDERTSNDATN